MTLDRHSAAAAERWPAERTIQTIKPTSARMPRRIHSHSRLVPDPPLGVWELLGCAFTDALAAVVVTVTFGLGEAAALEVMALGLAEVALGLAAGALGLAEGGVGLGEVALALGEGVVAALEVAAVRLGDKLATAL